MTVSGQANPVTYGYDNANRITQIAQGSNVVSLAYDAAGRRASLTLPNGVAASYTYDAASQLAGISYANGSNVIGDLSYTYDQNGNRVQIGGTLASTGLPSAVSAATYNENNQLQQWGSTSLSYDLNGNLLSDGTNTYAWDARNQLASITGAVFVTPQYDALGRRILNPAGQTLLYDGPNIVQEQSSNGSVTANLLTGPGIDEHFLWADSSGSYSYLTDGLNSTLALTDSDANPTTQYSYDPFGSTTSTGTSFNTLEYTGRENDGTGLYYYRARYYSPALHRFVSEDPLGFGGRQADLYSYVADNPLGYTDASGNNAAAITGFDTFLAASQLIPGWDALVDGALLGTAIVLAGAAAYTSFAKPPNNAWAPDGPKAPGYPGQYPTMDPPYVEPKGGPNWIPNPNAGKGGNTHGWEDAKGKVWCPTGPHLGRAHGGPHYDVQDPKTGDRQNVYPPRPASQEPEEP